MANISEQIAAIAKANPAIVFQNNGYEYLPRETWESNKAAIFAIDDILRKFVVGYIGLYNLKIAKNGETVARYEVYYNDAKSFHGVAYTPLAKLDVWADESAHDLESEPLARNKLGLWVDRAHA